MQLLHFFSQAHLKFLRNGNKIKGSEKVQAITYLKWKMKNSIAKSPIVTELGMRELRVPIP